jgi:hypothetical protein
VEASTAHDAEVDASMSGRDAGTSRPLKSALGGHTPHHEPSAAMRNTSLHKLLRMSQNVPGSPSQLRLEEGHGGESGSNSPKKVSFKRASTDSLPVQDSAPTESIFHNLGGRKVDESSMYDQKSASEASSSHSLSSGTSERRKPDQFGESPEEKAAKKRTQTQRRQSMFITPSLLHKHSSINSSF